MGGGDGGILPEVLKHPQVESVVQCEIDEDVISLSKKYLPALASGFSDPKLHLVVGDGFEYLQNHRSEFDVIITDSSDPVGWIHLEFEFSAQVRLFFRSGRIVVSDFLL